MLKSRIIKLAVAAVSIASALGLTGLGATAASATTMAVGSPGHVAAATAAVHATAAAPNTGAIPAATTSARSLRVPALVAQNFFSIELSSDLGCFLHAHAHNSPIQDLCNSLQTWQFINLGQWKLPDGNTVTVNEVEVGSTDLCLNYVPANFTFYADSCIAGDTNELFFVQPVSPTTDEFYFINEKATVSTGNLQYMSPSSRANGAVVVTRTGGYPSLEQWGVA